MSYTKIMRKTKKVIEVSEYHSARYGAPGQLRSKRKKPTPELIEKRNQYNKERTCRLKMNEHIEKNDYYVTLTFKKEERPPDMDTAKKIFKDMCDVLRAKYKKLGYQFKWFRNIEVGTKGAWHIHMVLNRIPDLDVILREVWKYGKVIMQLTYEKGSFKELAAYITKTPKTDKSLKEASYSASKNLPLPEPVKRIYKHWKTWKEFVYPEDRDPLDSDYHVRVPKGFYLDKESYHEGVNPFTGYKYRTYTLVKQGG